ncbi:MAG TPA: hypothetical protein VF407_01065 [Polyangiaceae bacterium]
MRFGGWAALAATTLLACSDSGPAPNPESTFVHDTTPQSDVKLGSYELIGGYDGQYRLDITADHVGVYGAKLGDWLIDRSKMTVAPGMFSGPDILGGVFRFPLERDGSLQGTWRHDDTKGGHEGGTITADTFAPTFTFTAPSFPWEGRYLTLSEPIDIPAFESAVKLHAGGTELPFSLGAVTSNGMITPDLVFLSDVTFNPWSSLAAKDLVFDIGALTDPSGNTSAPLSLPITMAVAPLDAIDFSRGRDSVYEAADDESLVTFRASDPVCETGSCLELGPYASQSCQQPGLTFASWISKTTPFSTLKVRYRILNKAAPTTSTAYALTSNFQINVPIEATATPVRASFDGSTPVTLSATTDLGMASATDWATLTIKLKTYTLNVGFQIGLVNNCPVPTDIRAAPTADTILLIGGVTGE